MKRITKYNIVNFGILLSWIVVFIINNTTNFFAYDFLYYFISTLCAIGISLIFKSIIFKSDSSLWFGILCITISVILFIIEIKNMNYKNYWVLLTIAPIVANIIVLIVFRDLMQLRLMTYILLFIAPFWLVNFMIIPLWCAFLIDTILLIFLLLYNILWNARYKK